jgi:predicted enzyme related to lactoylglutathione lyase
VITHVKFVSIPTRDQYKALAFYTEKLGFKLVTDQPHDDKQRWIEMRIGGFFNGALACDNVEKTYEELKAQGVEFMTPPTKQPWGTFAIFKDLDDNQFLLSSK